MARSGIIDFHTHTFPDRIAAGAVSAIVLLAGLAFMVNFLYFNGSALTLLNQAKIRTRHITVL